MNIEYYQTLKNKLTQLRNRTLVPIQLPWYQLLHGGEEFVENLYQTIDKSNFQIMTVNYTLENDTLSNQYLKKLIEAQQRGVQVFLFIDKLVSKPNKTLLRQLKRQGGNILYRNKKLGIQNSLNWSYFQRDHEKILLADNKILLGSANISKDYGGKKYGNDLFMDMNLLTENCGLKDILQFFQALKKDLRTKDQKKFRNYNQWAEHLSRYPDSLFAKDTRMLRTFFPYYDEIQMALLAKIQQAKNQIRIVNPYYYSVGKLENEILNAAQRGVDVQFITSKYRDVPCYKVFKNWQLFKNYENSKVKLYEYDKNFLHAKSLLIDQENVLIGSFNFDFYSWAGNNEMMLDIHNSNSLVEQFNSSFDQLLSGSKEVSFKNKSLTFKQKIQTKFWTSFLNICERLLIHRDYYNFFSRKKIEL